MNSTVEALGGCGRLLIATCGGERWLTAFIYEQDSFEFKSLILGH